MRSIRGQLRHLTILALLLGGLLLAIPAAVLAAKGSPGKPGGGEETAGNNLSFPATTFTATVAADWSVPENPQLGVHYSYGCDKPEADGQYTYPNTSCVNNLMAPTVYYTADECTDAIQPSPCQDSEVSRIYWQKVAENSWSAEQDNIAGETATVAYLDWGDALEAVSWNERSIIRVETQPYSSQIAGFDPGAATCKGAADDNSLTDYEVCKVGLQMWHVSGQGTTEQWGVRADENAVSYNYDSPFQIINTGSARLNLAKMSPLTAECPSPGGGDEGETVSLAANVAPGEFTWDQAAKVWTGSGETGDPCTWLDDPYSVELSVGGKYVYGYNWRMKNVELDSLCGSDWEKTGWWRLTFYTTDNVVAFTDDAIPVTAPPAVPAEIRDLPRAMFNTALSTAAPPAESDVLYTPVIDVADNLTYLDICIVGKTQGGGGSGGGKPDNGGGPGGGGGGGPGGPK